MKKGSIGRPQSKHVHTANECLDALIPFREYQDCGTVFFFFFIFYLFYSSLHIASTPVSFLILCHSANEMSVHTYLKMKYCFDTTRNKQKKVCICFNKYSLVMIQFWLYNSEFLFQGVAFLAEFQLEFFDIFLVNSAIILQIHLPLP